MDQAAVPVYGAAVLFTQSAQRKKPFWHNLGTRWLRRKFDKRKNKCPKKCIFCELLKDVGKKAFSASPVYPKCLWLHASNPMTEECVLRVLWIHLTKLPPLVRLVKNWPNILTRAGGAGKSARSKSSYIRSRFFFAGVN